MKRFTFLFLLTMHIEAFEIEFIKPSTDIPKIKEKIPPIPTMEFSAITPPNIKPSHKKDAIFSQMKLTQGEKYDPYEESKKVANAPEPKKTKTKVLHLHRLADIEHIVYS